MEIEVDLHESKAMLTKFCTDIPELKSHLAPDTKVVERPCFESAIEKIQGGEEEYAQRAQKECCHVAFFCAMMSMTLSLAAMTTLSATQSVS